MVDSRSEMPDLPDYQLLQTAGKPPDLPPPRRPFGLWLAVAGLIAATAIAAYIAFCGRTTSLPVTSEPERVVTPQEPLQPLGGDAASIVLPPLDRTDFRDPRPSEGNHFASTCRRLLALGIPAERLPAPRT